MLISLTSCICAEHYYIVPNDSNDQCMSYSAGTCFTLDEFPASNISDLDLDNNLTLNFLPGEHLLTRRLMFNGPKNIALTRQNTSNSSMYTIKCQGTSGFEFGDIKSLNVEYLEFAGCGDVEYGGAIFINRVDMFLVRGCHFINNHVTLYGGAVYVVNVVAMNIEVSIFNNNSAFSNDDLSAGGAIYVYSGNISSTNDYYINNSTSADHGGGAIYVESGSISSTNDYYMNNSADYGGAIYVESGSISSTNDYYMNNSADYGGAIYVESGSISSTNDHYMNNSAEFGGAICVKSVNISSTNDYYKNNNAYNGGAIFFDSGNISSTNDHYMNNNAFNGGAILVDSGNISSTNDHYINNSAGYGGAIYVKSSNISSTNDHYMNNSAEFGGAISVFSGNISSTNDYYMNNNAHISGGAIYVESSNISSTNDHYMNNNAAYNGGAILVDSGNISSTNDHYMNNSAGYGGAIYVKSSNISSTNDYYMNNSADIGGGAIYVESGNISSTNDYYMNNNAYNGGAIFVDSGNISSTNDHYMNNSAGKGGGAIYVESGTSSYCNDSFNMNTADDWSVIHQGGGTLEISHISVTDNKGNLFLGNSIAKGVNFINNQGSLYVFNTQVQINGAVVFINNSGYFGGAITARQSQIVINTASTVTISNNIAVYGGGIYLTQSNLYVNHPFELTENKASEYGGGIYASRSEIHFSLEHTQTLEINNNTARNGGAIYAIASSIHVQISNTSVDFDSNRAILNGGAMYLGQNSKIYLLKEEPEYMEDDILHVGLDFTSNYAEKGGAIYVADNTDNGVLCQGANREINEAECFIQTLRLYNQVVLHKTLNFINIFFTNNTAHQSGSDIYGGLLDRCNISRDPQAELYYHVENLFGFNYIKAITQIEHIIDYSQYAKSHPDYLINKISRSDVIGLISSDGTLKFCSDNIISSTHNQSDVSIIKGALFTISVEVVDQVGNPMIVTVTSSLSSESGNSHFKGGQVEQQVQHQCTELEYNVYSQDNSAQLDIHLYAEGPCGNNIDVSRLTVNLTFLPCKCPVGFQPSSSLTECICECDRRLQVTSCFAENGTIQLDKNIWIGVTNSTNGTGFVIHDCPFDYCVQKPVNISLNNPDSADEQCAYNRIGVLCGMCKDLSLVLGSSRCKDCSSYYIFLLIPFALVGIALVAFILLLNISVASGTIHGLILYVNILTANHSLFLPFATPNFLTVFISWLNLDLGIETCLYNGMDSYGKFLLQLAFPTYVFVLIGTIIVLCEVSMKFTTLLGNRNPVAALCTLILLSYSKLIRTIITALQFTYLNYPDGSREIVWLYDANIPYFTLSHIPRFVAAFIIFILGTVYTILLLFGQWFPRFSNRKFMKWSKNTKYNAFIDAYHAPFTPKHRYWMGLLLFAITTHNIVAAMATDSPAPILSAGCIAHVLILLKLLNTGIYKNRLQDSLETLFLTNISVLTIATYHIRETNENQLALANTSMAISFTLFLVILGYHFYKYILKGTRVWARVTQQLQRIVQPRERYREFDVVPQVDEEDNEQDELVREMEPPYTDDNDTDPIDLPHVYDPPVIVPAVRYDQPREPVLDFDPITTDDYRQLNQPPAPRPRQVPTSTVIDFVRPRRNVDHLDNP